MAKTPKVKKTQTSIHSRAARRKTTSPPPPNLALKSPAEDKEQQSWLYHAQNAGISKKKKEKKPTRNQKLRQQRGLQNAERNNDRLERKVEDSKRRGKKLKQRTKDWEEAEAEGDVQWVEVNGKVLQVMEDENGSVGLEKDGEGKKGRTWAEKMVEVELEEAMDEIEGFALPGLGVEMEGEERVGAMELPKTTVDAVVEKMADDVDEVT